MKAPPAPVVLTAGGASKKQTKSKAKSKNLSITVDEESAPKMHADDAALVTHGELDSSEIDRRRQLKIQEASVKIDDLYKSPRIVVEEVEKKDNKSTEYFWLAFCFFGIMGSFVAYGLLLEYATTGGKRLHELSFLFVTSLLYTCTAWVGRYVRAETPSTIPPAQFAVLGMTSMGSTFFSVRALRYVIYPIQVLAKSCKPVPVMLMGALMGKKYPAKKYLKVVLIVGGVCLFMMGG
jgi:hypothetical protein